MSRRSSKARSKAAKPPSRHTAPRESTQRRSLQGRSRQTSASTGDRTPTPRPAPPLSPRKADAPYSCDGLRIDRLGFKVIGDDAGTD